MGGAAADRRCSCSTRCPRIEARRLVAAAGGLGAGAAARIVETAEGNPLFLEQLVAVGADGAASCRRASRRCSRRGIDRLEPGERALLEHASVQGRSFHADAALLPEATGRARLVALVQQAS